MENTHRSDAARQAANVAGAIFQIAAGPAGAWLAGVDIGAMSNEHQTLITPAGYAFSIWGPIFGFSVAYAVYQALPGQRRNPLLRRIGWGTATAFLCSGLWEVAFPFRQYLLAEGLIIGAVVGMGLAFVRFAQVVRDRREVEVGRVERWLIGPTLGLYAGWITAANVVSVAVTLVALGRLDVGPTAATLGAILLLGGGMVAATLIRIGKDAPVGAWASYGGAMLWALAAVVASQREVSLVTTGAAIGAALPVGAALLGWWPRSFPGRRGAAPNLARQSGS